MTNELTNVNTPFFYQKYFVISLCFFEICKKYLQSFLHLAVMKLKKTEKILL